MKRQPTTAIPARHHPRRTVRSTSLRALAVAAHLEKHPSTTPRPRGHDDR